MTPWFSTIVPLFFGTSKKCSLIVYEFPGCETQLHDVSPTYDTAPGRSINKPTVALRRPDDPIGCEGPVISPPVVFTDVGTSCRLQCFMGRALN